MKQFILIGHKKQQGKDTFGKMLKEELGDAEILSFADPMREILAEQMGVSVAEFKEIYNNDDAERDKVKTFGNGKMIDYFGEQVWRDVLLRRAEKLDCKYIIVPDFRFMREFIEDAVTIKVMRDADKGDDLHVSETELDCYKFDWYVENNDTLEDLRNDARHIARTINLKISNKYITGKYIVIPYENKPIVEKLDEILTFLKESQYNDLS